MGTPGLALRGVMGYEGHVQPVRSRDERAALARTAMAALVDTAARLRAAGLPCDIVSAGGTGTYDISGRVPGVTEIQAGSYALMDTDYGEVGRAVRAGVLRPRHHHQPSGAGSLRGRRGPQVRPPRTTGCRRVAGLDGATVTSLNDEHATIAIPPSSAGADRRSHPAASLAHRPDRQPPRRAVRHRGRSRRRCLARRRARLLASLGQLGR